MTLNGWIQIALFLLAVLAALLVALLLSIVFINYGIDELADPRLRLKIADSREELEACFALLHDMKASKVVVTG